MKTHAFLLPALFSIAACAAPAADRAEPAESTGTTSQPIIGGKASPAAQDAVILLSFTDGTTTTPWCTGTLIGHKVVLTARHCVSNMDEQGTITSDASPDIFLVYPGVRAMADATVPARAAARSSRLFVPPATTILNADIALLVLDRAVSGPVAAVRLDGPPKVGEALTLVGWGITETGRAPDERLQRTGASVVGVGPTASTTLLEVGSAEFRLGEGTCFGDSGGPSFSSTTMAVLGIVSRGTNGVAERTEKACIGNDVQDVHTSIASFKPLVMQAFAAAGEAPTLEKAPEPPPATPPPDTKPSTSTKPEEGTKPAPRPTPTGRTQGLAPTESSGCSSAPLRNGPLPSGMALGLALAAGLVALRRARRSDRG